MSLAKCSQVILIDLHQMALKLYALLYVRKPHALLYRSPSVSMATLITVVSRILTYVSVSNIPCVILGDFNENLLHQHDSSQ